MVAGLTHWLRNSLETASRVPTWDKLLARIWMGSIVYFGLSRIHALGFLNHWYVEIIFLIYLATVYKLREHRTTRLLFVALLPIGIVICIKSVFEFLTPHFYKSIFVYFETAGAVTTFWMLGFGIYAFVQIGKDRKLRVKQEAEAKIAEARKLELEQLVTDRTTELTLQKAKLEQTLTELQATQAQLIQSEKLASLGELTAGIAHEIQNPLNFVNNFSELNVELAAELEEELAKDPVDKELVSDLIRDISQNQQKINHHGKRAASIVSGMLQHARSSSGTKEPTDLNALADEYLRLAYHGLRAKDQNFNATMQINLDEKVGIVEVIPQDFGRVLLNLITNAFYAVTERKKLSGANGEAYEPTVSVSTKRVADKIILKVKDNGNGIPASVLDKIFQPFFTTKPTGQGTGLGLSLAYDIVTKGHGGELKVKTKEGEGTTFILHLPV